MRRDGLWGQLGYGGRDGTRERNAGKVGSLPSHVTRIVSNGVARLGEHDEEVRRHGRSPLDRSRLLVRSYSSPPSG